MAVRSKILAIAIVALSTVTAAAQSVQPVVPLPYQYQSAGAGQYGLAITSAQTLTVPAGSLIAEICVDTAAARYTTTGTTPSSSVGIPVVPQSSSIPACFQLSGAANLSAFKIIGSGATIDVEYFR